MRLSGGLSLAKQIQPTPDERKAADAASARQVASEKRLAESKKPLAVENNDLYLPNVTGLSRDQVISLKSIVTSYAADKSVKFHVYGANGSERTNNLTDYSKWLDALL